MIWKLHGQMSAIFVRQFTWKNLTRPCFYRKFTLGKVGKVCFSTDSLRMGRTLWKQREAPPAGSENRDVPPKDLHSAVL